MAKDSTTNNSKTYPQQKHKVRKIIRFLCIFIFLLLLLLFLADFYVGAFSAGRVFGDLADVPHCRAALVLGCGKYVEGRPNLFYQYRIDAAAALWQAGKIDAVLVSGDNSRKDYDEPSSMKADLVEKGIPAEYIAIDYAGFRTLDSVVRAGKVFGLNDYVVVSQPFHCRRAVYLANQNGQSAIGYCARDVAGPSGLKVRLRETLARAKAVVDILISKQPRFLGQPETMHYHESVDEKTQ